jgi:Holliday junction resolvase RusA-like endonuclease
MTLTFTVFGTAEPQGSAKAFLVRGRPIITSDNPSLRQWRDLVSKAAHDALGALPAADRTLLLEGVRLTVAFYLPRPKSLPKKMSAHVKKPDLDKLLRSVNDSLSAIVFRDDSQVCELVAVKHYAAPGGIPHVHIRVEPTAGDVPLRVPAAPLPLFSEVCIEPTAGILAR